MEREYEWDEEKRLSNIEKHGLDFAEMKGLDLLGAIIVPDDRRNYGEARFRAYFRAKGTGRALSFTWRGGRIRIISLRPAREREMRRYEP
jgi:uncharacterized DUF497 family protein